MKDSEKTNKSPGTELKKARSRIAELEKELDRLKKAEKEIRVQHEEIAILFSISRDLVASVSPDALVKTAVRQLFDTVDSDVVMFFRKKGKKLVHQKVHMRDSSLYKAGSGIHKVGECLCGLAAGSGIPVYSRDIRSDPRCMYVACKEAGIRSVAVLPLKKAGRILGVLSLASKRPKDFAKQRVFLETVAGEIAVGMHNAILYEKLREHAGKLKSQLIEIKRTEEALKESEERFRLLADYIPVGIFMADFLGHFVYMNKRWCEISGLSVSDAERDGWVRAVHPEDRERVSGAWTRAVRSGLKFSIEYRFLKRGKKVAWVSCIAGPLCSERGEIVGYLGSIIDITERNRAEEALRESEERYRSFVQNFQGIAFQGHMDFTIIFFHGAVEKITGYTQEEFLAGRPKWDQIIHPEDFSNLRDSFEKMRFIPNFSITREYRIIRKDGEIRWIEENSQNICDDSGKPAYVQGALYDITERKNEGRS